LYLNFSLFTIYVLWIQNRLTPWIQDKSRKYYTHKVVGGTVQLIKVNLIWPVFHALIKQMQYEYQQMHRVFWCIWCSQVHATSYDSNNSANKCNSFISLLIDVYVWLNMFRAYPRPSSGTYSWTRSRWFYLWREASGVLLVVVWYVNLPDHAPDASLQW
jgi:TM2 domain-containing membrane protein YozV